MVVYVIGTIIIIIIILVSFLLQTLAHAVHVWQEHKGAGAQFDTIRLAFGGQDLMDPLLARPGHFLCYEGLHVRPKVRLSCLRDESAFVVGSHVWIGNFENFVETDIYTIY